MQRIMVVFITIITLIGAASSYSAHRVLQDKSVTTEESGDDRNSNTSSPQIKLVSFKAIINFVQFDLHFASYLIQELIQVGAIIHFPEFQPPAYFSNFHKTLFRLIISPNAP